MVTSVHDVNLVLGLALTMDNIVVALVSLAKLKGADKASRFMNRASLTGMLFTANSYTCIAV